MRLTVFVGGLVIVLGVIELYLGIKYTLSGQPIPYGSWTESKSGLEALASGVLLLAAGAFVLWRGLKDPNWPRGSDTND